jgi:hypothetical protein
MTISRNRAARKVLRQITLEFHQRAFGEEMARVNFLPAAERKEYLARLHQRARRARQRAKPGLEA